MSVLGRLLFSSAERLDLADLLSMDSYTAGDFKYLLKSFVGDTVPYILKGFDIINPAGTIGTSECSIRVADSVVYYPGSSAGCFFFGLPEGNSLSIPLVPELRSSATNYLYLTFTTTDQATDSRAFWDPDKNGGEGGEFSQEVNTESVLVVDVNTSVSTFPNNTIPIAKVTTNSAGIIQTIEDCRDMMFRLGTGGANPDPYSSYSFRPLPSTPYARVEPSTIMTGMFDPNPFQGGDKNIYSLKEWMDVVMTKLKELSGTAFWYQLSTNVNLTSLFQDTLGSTLKSKGTWVHDSSIPGKVTWTADIIYKSVVDPRDIIVRQGSLDGGTLPVLLDEHVAFIELVRNADINSGPTAVNFYNGLNYINGVLNSFQNLSKGDWIKKKTDSDDKYLRVEEFYSGANLTGTAGVAPSVALSVRLSGNYTGITAYTVAVYTKGEYLNSDVQVTARNAAAIQTAGGNFFWLVARSDIVLNISSAISTTLSGTVTANDGITATISSTGHNLVDGDRITLTAPVALAGTYVVEVKDADTFSIGVSASNTGAFTGYYAIVTTTSRNTTYGFNLETAEHSLEANETVVIAGTTDYDGSFQVNPRSPTTFQIPIGSPYATALMGTTSAVRVHVRKSFGSMRIEQGESIEIGEVDGVNIQKFIGMTSLSEVHPTYMLPSGYNTLAGQENFNALASDNLTQRTSKLSAMMADRVQDRGLRLRGSVTVHNTTNGANQDITGSNTIVLDKPKSPSQTITLDCSLPVNSAGVVVLDREGSGALTVTVESLGSSFLLEENKLILFYRLSDSNVYSWDAHAIPPNGTYTLGAIEHLQNKNIHTFYPAEVSLDTVSTSPTYNRLFFDDTAADLTIIIPGSTNNNTLDTSAAMSGSGITLLDGQALWVRVNRHAAKIFNTVQSSDVPDTDANGAIYVTARTAVPNEQDVFVLYQRYGNALLGVHNLDQLKDNVYEEIMDIVAVPTPGDPREIAGPVPVSTIITLPPDSRDYNNPQYYIYGSGQLEVFLNGQMLYKDRDYNEVVGSPIPSLSNSIEILQQLEIDDDLMFRVDTSGSVYFANSGALSFTMQDTYNAGRFITTNSGQPIVINGPIGEKLLQIFGDIEVTGMIDPKGISFTPIASDPMTPSQNGLWVNTSGELIYKKTSSTNINLVTDFLRRDSTQAMLANLDVGGFKVINLAAPLDDNDAARKKYVDDSSAGAIAACLKLDGTNSMGADINVNAHKVVGVVDPVDLQDAATKNYVDNQDALMVRKDGAVAMTGNLNLNTHKIVGVVDPVDPQDAATKNYVDQPASRLGVFATITNNTGSTLLAGSVVAMSHSSPGEGVLAKASSLTLAEGTVGVVHADILNGDSGFMQVGGEATVLGGPFDLGRRVYVSAATAGIGTPVAPSISGTVVYFLGVASAIDKVILSPNLDAINDNVYDESIDYISDVSSGTPISLPVDSRNGGASQTYVVGEGLLEVYLNGQYLHLGDDWSEVGLPGDSSGTIVIGQDILAGDRLTFRINIKNSAYFMSSSGAGGSLQTAYNNGRFITTSISQPIDISGPSGEKLMSIHGDIGVDGIIDPKGMTLIPQSTSPIPLDQAGIWANADGHLMHQLGDGSSAANISTSLMAPETVATGLKNMTGLTIDKGTPVAVDTQGEIALVDVSDEALALSLVGVANADIVDGAFGAIVTHGVLKGIATTATFGDIMYVAKDGTLTNIKPTTGENGFVTGDFVIKVGVLVRDAINPSNKNLIVNLRVVGQL